MQLLMTVKALLAAALTFQAASAHNIVLPSHGVECFHETLHKDDTMTVTFQVGDREFGSSGNLQIDFWVSCPLFFILFSTFHMCMADLGNNTPLSEGEDDGAETGSGADSGYLLLGPQPCQPVRVQ